MDPTTLRRLVLLLLDGGRARARAAAVLDGFPIALAGERPGGATHSAWQLLEHLRIAQADILQYCIDADYEELPWPAGYWPTEVAPPTAAAWRRSAKQYLAALGMCAKVVRNRRIDLLSDLPFVPGVTWLQELFLIADHNAYHLGQLMLLRRMLEATPRPARRRARR